MARYLSITFDDGLYAGAVKATRLLNQHNLRACFYLVTDWVRPTRRLIHEPFNAGRDHGSWDDWREIKGMGHEIGSHTMSHFNAGGRRARWLPGRLRRELHGSYKKLLYELETPPVSIAMPWNAATPRSEALVRRIFKACRLGTSEVSSNDLSRVDWWNLKSWAPKANLSVSAMCSSIDELRESHWLILQFHSLDDEGYMPISSTAFNELLAFISCQRHLRVVTLAEMVSTFAESSFLGDGTPYECVPFVAPSASYMNEFGETSSK